MPDRTIPYYTPVTILYNTILGTQTQTLHTHHTTHAHGVHSHSAHCLPVRTFDRESECANEAQCCPPPQSPIPNSLAARGVHLPSKRRWLRRVFEAQHHSIESAETSFALLCPSRARLRSILYSTATDKRGVHYFCPSLCFGSGGLLSIHRIPRQAILRLHTQ